jgi:hypothetical protein
MQAQKLPRGTRELGTYQEMQGYLGHFAAGLYPFVWLFGRPGTAKTMSIIAAMKQHQHLYISGGQLTALEFYVPCFRHRGQPVVLDDVEHLLDDTIGRKLISALGGSSKSKRLSYRTSGRYLREQGVEPEFVTVSPLCIVANDITRDKAIQSRAYMLYFNPSNYEIHNNAVNWFWNQEIHNWIGRHLAHLSTIDARDYVRADLDMLAKRNWQSILLHACAEKEGQLAVIAREVERDPACQSAAAKDTRFADLVKAQRIKGGSRATYQRVRSRLGAHGLSTSGVEPITVQGKRPKTMSQEEAETAAAVSSAPPPATVTPPEGPLDVPARADFGRPITGAAPAPARTQAPRMQLDDQLLGESAEPEDDEDASGDE